MLIIKLIVSQIATARRRLVPKAAAQKLVKEN